MESGASASACHPERSEGSRLNQRSEILREYTQDDKLARWWFPVFLAAYAFRVWYCWWRQLVPDEAVYWTWSRHLDLSYFDHPPMIAYLIAASTRLFGSTELGVRFGGATLAFAAVLILLASAQRIYADRQTLALLAIFWITSPLLAGISTITTPDAPALFFPMGALAIVLNIVRDAPGRSLHLLPWILF